MRSVRLTSESFMKVTVFTLNFFMQEVDKFISALGAALAPELKVVIEGAAHMLSVLLAACAAACPLIYN